MPTARYRYRTTTTTTTTITRKLEDALLFEHQAGSTVYAAGRDPEDYCQAGTQGCPVDHQGHQLQTSCETC